MPIETITKTATTAKNDNSNNNNVNKVKIVNFSGTTPSDGKRDELQIGNSFYLFQISKEEEKEIENIKKTTVTNNIKDDKITDSKQSEEIKKLLKQLNLLEISDESFKNPEFEKNLLSLIHTASETQDSFFLDVLAQVFINAGSIENSRKLLELLKKVFDDKKEIKNETLIRLYLKVSAFINENQSDNNNNNHNKSLTAYTNQMFASFMLRDKNAQELIRLLIKDVLQMTFTIILRDYFERIEQFKFDLSNSNKSHNPLGLTEDEINILEKKKAKYGENLFKKSKNAIRILEQHIEKYWSNPKYLSIISGKTANALLQIAALYQKLASNRLEKACVLLVPEVIGSTCKIDMLESIELAKKRGDSETISWETTFRNPKTDTVETVQLSIPKSAIDGFYNENGINTLQLGGAIDQLVKELTAFVTKEFGTKDLLSYGFSHKDLTKSLTSLLYDSDFVLLPLKEKQSAIVKLDDIDRKGLLKIVKNYIKRAYARKAMINEELIYKFLQSDDLFIQFFPDDDQRKKMLEELFKKPTKESFSELKKDIETKNKIMNGEKNFIESAYPLHSGECDLIETILLILESKKINHASLKEEKKQFLAEQMEMKANGLFQPSTPGTITHNAYLAFQKLVAEIPKLASISNKDLILLEKCFVSRKFEPLVEEFGLKNYSFNQTVKLEDAHLELQKLVQKIPKLSSLDFKWTEKFFREKNFEPIISQFNIRHEVELKLNRKGEMVSIEIVTDAPYVEFGAALYQVVTYLGLAENIHLTKLQNIVMEAVKLALHLPDDLLAPALKEKLAERETSLKDLANTLKGISEQHPNNMLFTIENSIYNILHNKYTDNIAVSFAKAFSETYSEVYKDIEQFFFRERLSQFTAIIASEYEKNYPAAQMQKWLKILSALIESEDFLTTFENVYKENPELFKLISDEISKSKKSANSVDVNNEKSFIDLLYLRPGLPNLTNFELEGLVKRFSLFANEVLKGTTAAAFTPRAVEPVIFGNNSSIAEFKKAIAILSKRLVPVVYSEDNMVRSADALAHSALQLCELVDCELNLTNPHVRNLVKASSPSVVLEGIDAVLSAEQDNSDSSKKEKVEDKIFCNKILKLKNNIPNESNINDEFWLRSKIVSSVYANNSQVLNRSLLDYLNTDERGLYKLGRTADEATRYLASTTGKLRFDLDAMYMLIENNKMFELCQALMKLNGIDFSLAIAKLRQKQIDKENIEKKHIPNFLSSILNDDKLTLAFFAHCNNTDQFYSLVAIMASGMLQPQLAKDAADTLKGFGVKTSQTKKSSSKNKTSTKDSRSASTLSSDEERSKKPAKKSKKAKKENSNTESINSDDTDSDTSKFSKFMSLIIGSTTSKTSTYTVSGEDSNNYSLSKYPTKTEKSTYDFFSTEELNQIGNMLINSPLQTVFATCTSKGITTQQLAGQFIKQLEKEKYSNIILTKLKELQKIESNEIRTTEVLWKVLKHIIHHNKWDSYPNHDMEEVFGFAEDPIIVLAKLISNQEGGLMTALAICKKQFNNEVDILKEILTCAWEPNVFIDSTQKSLLKPQREILKKALQKQYSEKTDPELISRVNTLKSQENNQSKTDDEILFLITGERVDKTDDSVAQGLINFLNKLKENQFLLSNAIKQLTDNMLAENSTAQTLLAAIRESVVSNMEYYKEASDIITMLGINNMNLHA